MVSGPSAISGNSLIQFRPDPGEPAARLKAPETQTALLVTAQEQRNETRLRAQAVARGDDIVFSNRSFTLGVGNLSPIFNGGLTTVTTRSDPNGFRPDIQPTASSNETEPTEDEPVEQEARAVPEDPEEATQPSEEELQREELTLDNEESRLERNLTRAQVEQEEAIQSADPVQFQQAEREQAQLERDQQELDREKSQNELEQLEQRLENFLDDAGDAIQGSADAAAGVLDVLFGLSNQNTLDTTAPVPALGNNGGPGFFASAPRVR